MGINSTGVAYNFGQLGSVFCDVDNVIIPPKDHVIVAIQFITDNHTPTELVPEKLDEGGPNFPAISGSVGDLIDAAGNNYFNFNGVWTSSIADASTAAGAEITLLDLPTDLGRIKVGNYVLLVNETATEGNVDTVIQTGQTPYPIYNGPNKQGVYVTAWDGVSKVKLSGAIDTSSTTDQALLFLDETHGAGGTTATGCAYPAGLTIYGRWVAFKPENAKAVICYFGK
jgi:hypothetical protein